MALTTARISRTRRRPPGWGGGIKSLIQSHSASVRSVGYGFAAIPIVYRADATSGRLFTQPLSLPAYQSGASYGLGGGDGHPADQPPDLYGPVFSPVPQLASAGSRRPS